MSTESMAPPPTGEEAEQFARAQAFRSVVTVLCGPPGDSGPPILLHAPAQVTLLDREGAVHVVQEGTQPEGVVGWLPTLVGGARGSSVHRILVVRPSPWLRKELESFTAADLTSPKGATIHLFVLDDAGELLSHLSEADSDVRGNLLAKLEEANLDKPVAPEVFSLSFDSAVARGEAWRGRAERFTAPRTWSLSLLTFIAVVFVLEELWGGSTFLPTVSRMGAVLGDGGTWMQPWRLLSSAVLHGSIFHVAVNGFTLFGLGGLIERVIGGPRMMLCFVLSALGGAAAAAATGGFGVTVGASGGLFGLFAMLAWIVWHPQGVMDLSPGRQKLLKNNLTADIGLLAVISLLPSVSLAGHLGGALVGLGLAASGLLVRPPVPDERPRTRVFGGIAAALVVLSFVLSLASGKPWQLTNHDDMVAVAHEGFEFEVPVAVVDRIKPGPRSGSAAYGEFFDDPFELRVDVELGYVSPSGQLDVAARAVADLWNQDQTVGEFTLDEEAVSFVDGEQALVSQAYTRHDGLVLRRAALLTERGRVLFEVVAFEGRPESRANFIEDMLLQGEWQAP